LHLVNADARSVSTNNDIDDGEQQQQHTSLIWCTSISNIVLPTSQEKGKKGTFAIPVAAHIITLYTIP
jgi:hypothetical protein